MSIGSKTSPLSFISIGIARSYTLSVTINVESSLLIVPIYHTFGGILSLPSTIFFGSSGQDEETSSTIHSSLLGISKIDNISAK